MTFDDQPGPRIPPWGGMDIPDFQKFWLQYKKLIIGGIVLALIVLVGSQCYFTVSVEEEAVILRFGKYIDTAEPGLHFKLPFIDTAIKGEVKTIHVEEFGFRTAKSDGAGSSKGSSEDREVASMLTADLNASEINWVVRYKIKNLRDFLFNVKNVREAIRDVSEIVMRKIVGDSSVDEVLMTRQGEMKQIARVQIQELLEVYGCGIEIREVNIIRLDPPAPVQRAFEEVNQARQTKEKTINEAEATRNREIIPAKGQKEKMILKARGYEEKRINEAEGDAHAFLAVLAEYEKAKEITRRRLYLETMAEILPRCGRIFLIDEKQRGLLPFLRLDEGKGGPK